MLEHECDHHLVVALLGRNRVGGALDDVGMGADRVLDLERADVLAAPADRVLQPVGEDEVPLVVHRSRRRPCGTRGCGTRGASSSGAVPVALRRSRAARGAERRSRPERRAAPGGRARRARAARGGRPARPSSPASPSSGRRAGGEPELGRPVHLDEREAEALVPRAAQLGRGRGAVCDRAPGGRCRPPSPGSRQRKRIDGARSTRTTSCRCAGCPPRSPLTENRCRSTTGQPTHRELVTIAQRPIVWKSGNIE